MSATENVLGVYRVERGAVNTYILNDLGSGLAVIDTGYPGTTHRILQLIRDIGRAPQDVKHILITHADVDHVGDLNALVDATGAKVYASTISRSFIQSRRSPPHLRFPLNLMTAIMRRFVFKAVPVDVDHVVADGDVLDIAGGIRVIATPGHTTDHVSYYWQREGVLFAGDLIRNVGDGLSLTPPQWTHDMAAAHQSARKVLALNPAVICPGHGEVWVKSQSPEQIDRLRE